MSNEIEKFDPSTLMQGVKDRIKATFVSLIPDDQWDQMVKKEVDDFFRESNSGYDNRRYTSEFKIVVWKVLEEEAKIKIKGVLANPEFQTTYNGNKQELSKTIQDAIVAKAPEIFMQAIQGSIAYAVQQMRYNPQ